MNGPQHYLEAERLLGSASGAPSADTALLIGRAQAHATLALAAATALAIDPTPEAVAAWDPHLLDDHADQDDDAFTDVVLACGQPLHFDQTEILCVLQDGHEDYHADGRGNRWTT